MTPYDYSGYYIWQREVNTVFFFLSRDGNVIVDIVLDKFIVPYGAVLICVIDFVCTEIGLNLVNLMN